MTLINNAYSVITKALGVVLLASGLAACGGSGGASTAAQPNPNNGGGGAVGATVAFQVYEGNVSPASEDVQNFRRTVWANLASDTRCGGCHLAGGDASTIPFVDHDNINTAYSSAINYVNLSSPATSRLVTEVASGHNCWLGNSPADINSCTSAITNYITAWAAASAPSSFLAALNQFAPDIFDIQDGKRFDETAPAEFTALHNTLTTYCSDCHTANSTTRQQPFFASSDVQEAYEAAQNRIDLNETTNSRLYVRLNSEGHNCWGDCAADSQMILNGINALAATFTADPLDAELEAVASKALRIDQGFVLSSGSRVENDAVGLWTFKEGTGTVARNSAVTNGTVADIDLILSGNIEWWGSGGVRINEGKLQSTIAHSKQLFDRIRETGEYSIEAWVVPLNVTQGENNPAGIVSFSKSTDARNFMLSQRLYNYDFYNRNTLEGEVTDGSGQPVFSTPDAQEVLQATLQHVVATYNATDGRRIYVNGELIVEENNEDLAGSFNDWEDDFAFVVGNEASSGRQWQGSVRLLAVHNAALGLDDVQTNFEIGVGEKYYTMFSVAHLTNIPETYVVFRVEEFDSYSYLFSEPIFYNANGSTPINNLNLSGMRIGINGREATSGQAYINVDATINSTARPPYIVDLDENNNEIIENGGMQRLSLVGTIVPLELGISNDQFFLTFDNIAGQSYARATPTFNSPAVAVDNDTEQSDIGIKNFAEINASLSALTQISSANAEVSETYEKVKQQMPISEELGGFVSAHQMGITQLAVKYCDVLVEQEAANDTNPNGYFFPFDFDAAASAAFDVNGKSQIITPLLDNLLANDIVTDQPQQTVSDGHLSDLIDTLLAQCNNDTCTTANSTGRTTDIAKATCAAALASAMMLIQ